MKRLWTPLGFIVSAVALYLAFRNVDFGDVWQALRGAAYLWIVPATALIVVSLYLRAVRWRLLFYPRTQMRFGNVYGSMNAGYFVNTVLPARLGEVVRAVLLARLEEVRVGHALSTVVVERVLDLLTTIVILALLIPFVELPEDYVAPLLAGSALVVLALLVMIVAGAYPALTHRIAALVTRFLPPRWAERLHHLIDSVLDGFKVLSRPALALRLGGLSVVIWLTIAAAMECMLLAFHLRLSPAAPMFVLALISLSFIVPSSPGHVGVFQFVAVEALTKGFGVDANVALSFALVTNLVSFAPPALLGLWFVWRSGLTMGRLVSFGKEGEADAEAEAGTDVASAADPSPAGAGEGRRR